VKNNFSRAVFSLLLSSIVGLTGTNAFASFGPPPPIKPMPGVTYPIPLTGNSNQKAGNQGGSQPTTPSTSEPSSSATSTSEPSASASNGAATSSASTPEKNPDPGD
jgi:hypothetical protein